jgi:hypothetical protein
MPTIDQAELPPGLELNSVILVNDSEWQVGVPLTPWASSWWGRQTDWCTRHDLASFESYVQTGVLIVFRRTGQNVSENQSWQLHPATGEFRDQLNRRASWRGFLQRHPELAGKLMVAFAMRQAGRQWRDDIKE